MHNTADWIKAAALAAVFALPSNGWAGACGFVKAFQQPDEKGTTQVQVWRGSPVPALGNAQPLLFISTLKVNTDGTKLSYHERDVTGRRCASATSEGPCAINNIRNAFRNPARPESDFEAVRDAGYPADRTWQVLSPGIIEKDARTGKPCLTPDGYLVSMTADVAVAGGFNRQGDCDLSKWIDALAVPALVIPGKSQFLTAGVGMRNVVVALSSSATRRVVPGIVGDIGPGNELGEASVAMNRMLNGLPEAEVPRHRVDAIARFQAGKTAIVVFTGNAAKLPRPITAQRVQQAGTDALNALGGADKLYACIREEIDPNF